MQNRNKILVKIQQHIPTGSKLLDYLDKPEGLVVLYSFQGKNFKTTIKHRGRPVPK